MTPDAKAVLEYQIGEVLRGFSVRLDYTASAGGPLRLYVVFDSRFNCSARVSDPAPHLQAQADLTRLQTAAIIQLIEETVP